MVSTSDSPSVNQRGTRDRDSWMANTCASSWVSTIPQLKARLLGACEVMTRPKQTPATPIAGRPVVRTANSSGSRKSSSITGAGGSIR